MCFVDFIAAVNLTCTFSDDNCDNCYGWPALDTITTTAGNDFTLDTAICCPTCAVADASLKPSNMRSGRGTALYYTDNNNCLITCFNEVV